MKKLLCACLFVMLISSCALSASKIVEGDVLVIMRANVSEITTQYLNSPECREYIAAALEPVDAKLITIYDAISWADGKIHFLARSKTHSTESMIETLKRNSNVISVSPNRINRAKMRTK